MRLAVVDFETYYDKEYSLSKMATEEYVNDPRFEIILVGVHFHGEQPQWKSGTLKQISAWFDELDIWNCCVIAHNAMFDGLIFAVHFGRLPRRLICTRMMANVFLKPHLRSVSLENCLKSIDLGIQKGTAVKEMLGRTRGSLSRRELEHYAGYCMDDCDGTMRLFLRLAPLFPKDELTIIDMTLRMYLEPRFILDAEVLTLHLAEVRAKKAAQLAALPPSITKDRLSSNPKFAKVLEELGVEVPMKMSPTTGVPIFAFAKNDTGWKELEEEYADDPLVSAVLTARMGAKSTLEESRTERLIDIALNYPLFRVPLMYYAAHTGRYGGTEGINAQNFPRVDKSRMRFGIKAPKGYVVLAADLAQIEARITAWLAGELALLEGFRTGVDLYSLFASRVFKTEVVKDRSPNDKKMRFVGKTCILGLGFGMGPPKLMATLRKDGLKFLLPQVTAMVELYRSEYWRIPQLWEQCDNALRFMASGQGQVKIGPVTIGHKVVILPNSMPLQYPKLRFVEHEDEVTGKKRLRWTYNYGTEIRTMWGGKLVENIVQALARLIVMKHMLEIYRKLGLRPALQQHDELDYVVLASEAEYLAGEINKIMSVPPEWAPDLPVAVEINYGPSLGDCK